MSIDLCHASSSCSDFSHHSAGRQRRTISWHWDRVEAMAWAPAQVLMGGRVNLYDVGQVLPPSCRCMLPFRCLHRPCSRRSFTTVVVPSLFLHLPTSLEVGPGGRRSIRPPVAFRKEKSSPGPSLL